jgi:hypothetical protein
VGTTKQPTAFCKTISVFFIIVLADFCLSGLLIIRIDRGKAEGCVRKKKKFVAVSVRFKALIKHKIIFLIIIYFIKNQRQLLRD